MKIEIDIRDISPAVSSIQRIKKHPSGNYTWTVLLNGREDLESELVVWFDNEGDLRSFANRFIQKVNGL
jgi:hypothetical protein